MTTLSALVPSDTFYTSITTTTQAKREPETQIEFDNWILAIRKGKIEELYSVDEFPTGFGFDGRAFTLTKDRTGESYNLFFAHNDQDHLCDCRGFAAYNRCKHHDAIRHLIVNGLLRHPMEDAPPSDPWPSPEQLAVDAGHDLSY